MKNGTAGKKYLQELLRELLASVDSDQLMLAALVVVRSDSSYVRVAASERSDLGPVHWNELNELLTDVPSSVKSVRRKLKRIKDATS